MYKENFFGKVDLLASLFGNIEAMIMILCSFDFDLKKICRQHLLQKCCGGQPNNYLF